MNEHTVNKGEGEGEGEGGEEGGEEGEGRQGYIKFKVDGKIVPVPISTAVKSQHIKVLVDNFTDDLIIDIPDKFLPVIDNYIDFLNGDEREISNPDLYVPLFNMYTYFDDDEYLDYLINQVLEHWDIPGVPNVVYNDCIPMIQWEIFLCCSYQVIPKQYLTDVKFYLEWAALNTNAVYEDSNGDHYYNNVPVNGGHTDNDIVYVCMHGIKINKSKHNKKNNNGEKDGEEEMEGYGLTVGYYSNNGNIKYMYEMEGNYISGKYIKYYDNNQHTINSITYYVNDYKNGNVTAWYDNPQHTVRKMGKYKHNTKQELWKYWYDPTTFEDYNAIHIPNHKLGYELSHESVLEKQGEYLFGKKHGLWQYWYHDTGHSLREGGEYNHDKRTGVWKSWYPINNNNKTNVQQLGEYLNGEKDGSWQYWYDDNKHGLKEGGGYYHDKRIGMWTSWYPINDDGHSIMKEQGNYIYDKNTIKLNEQQNIHIDIKDGQWTQYDENGDMMSYDIYYNGQLKTRDY